MLKVSNSLTWTPLSISKQDMGLATDIAKRTATPLPLGQAAELIYSEVIAKDPDLARKDFSSVYRFLQSVSV